MMKAALFLDNGNIDLSSQNIGLYAAGVEIEAPSVDIVSSDQRLRLLM